MKNRRLFIIIILTGVVLLIPLISMQITEEVNWTFFDFIVMGILLFFTGTALEFVLRKVTQTKHRILLCGFVLGVCLLVWAELAVGILGTPFAGQ